VWEWEPSFPTAFPYWLLRVDEDSSEEDIEAEIEYWMSQIQNFELEGDVKKSLMAVVRWLVMLLELRDGD
jgi:hypothetical protein